MCWCADKVQPPSQTELDAITSRGRLLAEYDQAAWHSSDAVQALHPPTENLGRFIAQKGADGRWTVAFGKLNQKGDRFLIALVAVQAQSDPKDFKVSRNEPPQEDSGFYLIAAKAIDIALKDFTGERRPYNVAVLPAADHQMYVYIYPAQTENDVYPLGGDARYLVSQDGENIIEKRQMHKTILDRKGSLTAGSKMESGYHTHVLSDVPEDTDVFNVLSRAPLVPELVGTEHFIYEVQTNGTIRIIEKHNWKRK